MTKYDYLIDPTLIKAALVCASNEETRYYLKGVYFEKRGTIMRMVSTDGHRLYCATQNLDFDYCENGPDFGTILPLADLKKALTGVTKNVDKIICGFSYIDGRPDEIRNATVNMVNMTPVDGTYPDFTRVLPSKDAVTKNELAQFNAAYLGDMAKIAKILGHHGNSVHVQHCGASPAIITFGIRSDVVCLLMPLRDAGLNMGLLGASDLLGATGLHLHNTPQKETV